MAENRHPEGKYEQRILGSKGETLKGVTRSGKGSGSPRSDPVAQRERFMAGFGMTELRATGGRRDRMPIPGRSH